MKRLENLYAQRERVIMSLEKETKNRVDLLVQLMDIDHEIEEISTSVKPCIEAYNG